MYMQKCNSAFYFNECEYEPGGAEWNYLCVILHNYTWILSVVASKRTEYGIIFTLKIESDIKYCYNLPWKVHFCNS